MSVRKVIGIHSSKEALKVRSSQELKKLYIKPDWNKSVVLSEMVQLAKSKNVTTEVLSLKKLDRIGEFHQGVCVLVEHQLSFDIDSLGEQAVVLVLDRIQDTRNLGAIIRTAWLMGVDCIFTSSHQSATLSPFVIKTASGGVEHIPVEIKKNLRQCLEELKKNQFWIYALDSHSSHCFWDKKIEGRMAFLLGGESLGVRPGLKKFCDGELSIPQTEKSSSYNVSVTAGIILAECLRQKTFGD